jgi:hypothetical protein
MRSDSLSIQSNELKIGLGFFGTISFRVIRVFRGPLLRLTAMSVGDLAHGTTAAGSSLDRLGTLSLPKRLPLQERVARVSKDPREVGRVIPNAPFRMAARAEAADLG